MKKSKLLSIVLSVLAIMFVLSFTSLASETEGYFTYIVNDGEATVTEADPSISGEITIPETLGGYPVVAIGDGVFSDFSDIESVIIPDTVTSIGKEAFCFCSNLSSIVLPKALKTIGEGAFSMSGVQNFIIPATVTSIGDISLQSFSLKSITVDAENEVYSSDDNGVLFNKDKTVLIQFPTGSDITSYVIPDTVKTIEQYAFFEAYKLKSVTIPNKVSIIDKYTFCSSGIESITIPDSVICIYGHAFAYCDKLEEITIGTGLKDIEHDAFYDTYIDNVYYKGTIGQWKNIDIAYSNYGLTNANIHYSECENHVFTYYLSRNDATYTSDGTKISYCDNLCGKSDIKVDKGTKLILGKTNKITATQSATAIKLSWNAVPGATGYRVYLYDKKTGKYTKYSTIQKISGTHKNLKPGTEYNYLIRAYKKLSDGTVIWAPYSKSDVFVTGTLPAKATGIKATQSTSAIKLTWKESPGATGYRVYKYVDATGKYTKLGTVQKLNGTIKNLKSGTTYAYLVRAYKKLSDGTILWADYSKSDVFYTSTKSEAPTLKATAGTKKFTLSWNKIAGATSYEIWYSTSANGTYKKHKTVTDTTYTKSSTTGRTYYFKVRAIKTVNGQTIKGEASTAKGVTIK